MSKIFFLLRALTSKAMPFIINILNILFINYCFVNSTVTPAVKVG